jgi:hypothetical protein
MKRNTVGELYKENVLREDFLYNSGDVLSTITPSIAHMDGLSFILCVDQAVRVITANGTTDHVVSGTKTWTFAGGAFGQGDVGGTFVLAGSASNNGSYVISTVVDEFTVTTVGAPVGNETFTSSVTATLTDLDLQATPTVQVSNNYSPAAGTFPTLGQVPNTGRWPDITAQFSPSLAPISGDGEQFVQCYPLVAQRARLTITPTAGAALISIFYCAKGNQ